MTTRLGFQAAAGALALAALVACFTILAPHAEAKKKPLDGQLVADAAKKGSKVEAPVLLSNKSAKKLKLRSPLATLVLKGSKGVPAPNPAGGGTVTVLAESMRAGDMIKGKGKRKGSAKKLMPRVKGSKLKIADRESAYSLDEVTAALAALYGQVGALGVRVDALEISLAALRAELEALKQQNAGLESQINSLLTQITDLQSQLDTLTNLVGGLPTAAQLEDLLDDIDDLQSQIDALGADLQSQIAELQSEFGALTSQVGGLPTAADIADLQSQITDLQSLIDALGVVDADLQSQLDGLTTQVTGLLADVNALCGLPIVGGVCP